MKKAFTQSESIFLNTLVTMSNYKEFYFKNKTDKTILDW